MKKHSLVFLSLFLLVFAILAAPVLAKKSKKTPTPAPVVSNLVAMQKAVRFNVYEKSSDVVSDVTGIFDNKAQKITLKCELRNDTKKEVHGVRGILRFTTQFHETVADITIESTAVLPPGKLVGVNWEVPTDRLKPEAFEALKKAKLEDLRQVWMPSMIAFTDGTVLK